ncbi:MAG: MurR/RpiR family transcriptional regulator [Clostridia bacterium]|nr:MurR/RpiR family transcriptional regulator [Clostridia bacterium]
MNITEIIKSNIDKMTKSERAVATYFLKSPNEFAFETLDSIAYKIKTSTTSVLRFCRKIGFDGYKVFQDEVRNGFKYQFTLPDKFKIASMSEDSDSQFPQYVINAINCIENTFRNIPQNSILRAAEEIAQADRVFCFGLKESFALAHYAYTRFLTVRNDVYLSSAYQSGEIESLLSLRKGDVCIFYLFHRYTKPAPQILKTIKNQGASVILITSPPFNEVEKDATVLLPCEVDINGIKNSSAAPVCITDCLCNMVVSKSGHQTLDYMKQSEILFKNFTFQET